MFVKSSLSTSPSDQNSNSMPYVENRSPFIHLTTSILLFLLSTPPTLLCVNTPWLSQLRAFEVTVFLFENAARQGIHPQGLPPWLSPWPLFLIHSSERPFWVASDQGYKPQLIPPHSVSLLFFDCISFTTTFYFMFCPSPLEYKLHESRKASVCLFALSPKCRIAHIGDQ